jgi:Fe-Mn family superoxide dismutase
VNTSVGKLPGATRGPYKAREFDLSAVTGLSQRALELHLELYAGYVEAFNALLSEQDAAFPAAGEATAPLDLASHARRFAFEYNGIVLHELFFDALGAPGGSSPDKQGAVADAAGRSFGGLEQWMRHAAALAKLRGIGWVVCVREPCTNRLYNCWVDLHHLMVPANTQVVLALDLWEHAYLLDFAPSQREKYFDMLWSSVDWSRIEQRFAQDAFGDVE